MFWTNVTFQTFSDTEQRMFELLAMVPSRMSKLHWCVQKKILGIFFTEKFLILILFLNFQQTVFKILRKNSEQFFETAFYVSRKVFEEKNVIERMFLKKVYFLKFSRCPSVDFGISGKKELKGWKRLSRLHSTCPAKHLQELHLFLENLYFFCFFSGFERTNFIFFCLKCWMVCQKGINKPTGLIWEKDCFWKNFTFFGFLNFCQKVWAGLPKLHLTVQRILLKFFFGKKGFS